MIIPRRFFMVMLFITLLLLAVACATAPVTGRRQITLFSSDQINSLSFDQYQEFLSEHQVITGTAEAGMVKRVGARISRAVERYLAENGRSNVVEGYEWSFNLVGDDQVNAFAMPGGKVVVYSGILPVAENEAGLAVVLGHEIGHAVAQHGNERMSQALIAQMGGEALSAALSSRPEQTRNLFMSAYGLGAKVGVLMPYGRLQESEADRLGLVFMAMAGYDPHEAIDFWRRMEEQAQGASTPEFLSTHPSHDTRISDIREYMPQAMKYYNGDQ